MRRKKKWDNNWAPRKKKNGVKSKKIGYLEYKGKDAV